jgi:hypothetical protein
VTQTYSRFVAVVAALSAFAVFGWGCKGSDPTVPQVGPPSRVTITTAPASSVVVGQSAGPMSVTVADAAGAAVSNATVNFTVSGNASVSPSSAVTDASGVASTTVTVGTLAGDISIVASVSGSSASATASIIATAGPVDMILVTPETTKLWVVGDTIRVVAVARDQYSNPTPSGALTYRSTDPSVVSVDATGLARAERQDGTARIVVSAGARADTSVVTVVPAGVTPCTGAAAATPMSVGQVATYSGTASGCLSGAAAGAEFALVAFNSSIDGTSLLSATVTGTGLGTSPSKSIATSPLALAARVPTVRGAQAMLVPDNSFHVRLQARAAQELRTRIPAARDWYRARRRGATSTTLGAFSVAPSYSAIPSAVTVGQVVRLNVNPNSACSSPTYHGARVMAVGSKSVVLADTLNPRGGFTDADYARFAARFDTLVYPLDTDAFGAPTDIDQNGKIVILFTRAVNELTPPGAGYYVGGFFFSRDLYPVSGDPTFMCAGSKEGEMFYMLAPDPNGEVNTNRRRTGFVDTITTATIAHEFQHLINASRRLYVNTSARDVDETVWLNEGLSHIAEELLYFRESGQHSRANLGGDEVYTNSRATYPIFKADGIGNFSRFISYLESPSTNSPVAPNDDLATRGATWSFLRYAVDQLYPADGAVWSRFDNSTTSGLGTLAFALGPVDLAALFRNWALANYVDDDGISGVDAAYTHKSWNARSVYGTVFGSYNSSGTVFTPISYPLAVTPLTEGVSATVAVRGASASYYRLAVRGGREALLSFASGVAPPDAALQFLVVRTK